MTIYGSFNDIARDLLGASGAALRGHRLDLRANKAHVLDSIASSMQRHDARRSTNEVKDAASAFVSSALAQILSPIERVSQEEFLFVEGRTGDREKLLPIDQKVELGKKTVEYSVVAHTGEARFFSGGAVRDLKRVGQADDKKEQNVGWYGVRFGWDRFELWQAAHLNRNVPLEQQNAARQFMDEVLEEVGSFGEASRKIPGMFNHGAALTFDLPVSMGDPSLTADQMLTNLGIIEAMWKRANPSRRVSGVVMPTTHRLNMLRVFNGTNDEGLSMWKYALEMYPWLAYIVESDRLLNASDIGASMWQMWSADAEELYLEASPAPMLFGPFDSEFETEFVMINQTAGVVNKRGERLFRIQMPS